MDKSNCLVKTLNQQAVETVSRETVSSFIALIASDNFYDENTQEIINAIVLRLNDYLVGSYSHVIHLIVDQFIESYCELI